MPSRRPTLIRSVRYRAPSRRGPILALVLLAILLWGLHLLWHGEETIVLPKEASRFILRERIAAALDDSVRKFELPSEIDFRVGDSFTRAKVLYSIDWRLQSRMEKLFSQYRPDYGAFVALDATSGEVLSLVSYRKSAIDLGHMALRASFPAASVFKIVTAAAVLERKRLNPESHIPFNGGFHTLYRRNVNSVEENRWTHDVTLSEAFAKSINTVFAKIGMYMLEPRDLREFAEKFQFNQPIPADVRIDLSHFELPDNDPWAAAEVASGFNRVATMSPIQGAMMASAIANDGIMMAPYVVDRLTTTDEGIVYNASPMQLTVAVSPDTAGGLQSLMRETVRIGTSRKIFRPYNRGKVMAEVEIGAKTGSLQGLRPRGKYDWWVGYAREGATRIAIAALTINEEKWQVKSSYLAKTFIEEYFKEAK